MQLQDNASSIITKPNNLDTQSQLQPPECPKERVPGMEPKSQSAKSLTPILELTQPKLNADVESVDGELREISN